MNTHAHSSRHLTREQVSGRAVLFVRLAALAVLLAWLLAPSAFAQGRARLSEDLGAYLAWAPAARCA